MCNSFWDDEEGLQKKEDWHVYWRNQLNITMALKVCKNITVNNKKTSQ